MRWQRFTVWALLLISWAAFAAWQYQSHVAQRTQIQETLREQSESVMSALLGGIRSHRRLGRFFETQLEGMLDELVTAQDVRSVHILTEDRTVILSAGAEELSREVAMSKAGHYWDPDGFRLVKSFEVQPVETGGQGGGMGGGFRSRWQYENDDADSGFADGGTFIAILQLDRTPNDRLIERSAWLHSLVTGTAALVVLCLAFAWRASMRLVEAQGRTRVLEIETRHLRELNQAAAGLAHETRNPLGLIRGWTQRLVNSDMTEAERRRHAEAMIEECDRVTARINQFLAFARPCEPQIDEVNVRAVVEELDMILKPDLEMKNLTLDYENVSASNMIRADRELFRQAMFNLVQNAIQFSPESDAVTVAILCEAGNGCRIEVADRGPGVVDEAVPNLFSPYYTTRPDGTGLGLAIVRRIAAAHGWQAMYRSRSDGGATFSLEGIHG